MVSLMADDTARIPAKPTGRKRDQDVTDAILSATAELLLEVGFAQIRTQDIAERAGAGKGAIYRRWPTKEALFAEAIRNMPAGEAPATDDPLADLRAIVAERCRQAEAQPDLVGLERSGHRRRAALEQGPAALGQAPGAAEPHE